jgi:replication-associated recombination protein RarA
MSKYQQFTNKGYDLGEVASALQKSVRRGLEQDAMYWAVELFNSNFDEYCWKRLRIISCEDIGLANPDAAVQVQSLYSMYCDLKKKKEDAQLPWRLMLTQAILVLCRSPKSRVVDHALLHFWNTHQTAKKEIPEYALDKHTGKGRSNGRGWKHFFEEGTRLEPLAEVPGESEYKKLAIDSIKKPISLFEDEQ